MSADRKKIFHLHIQKTSGTVLYRAIKRHYGEGTLASRSDMELESSLTSPEDLPALLEKTTAISGHFFTSVAQFPEEFERVTLLRNPIARSVSHFNQIKNDTKRPRLFGLAKDKTILEAMRVPLLAQRLCNGQTRALVAAAGGDFDTLSDQENIELALETLRKMRLVGFQENLRPFYEAVHEVFGFKVDYTVRVNTDITDDGLSALDTSHISGEMAEMNRLDIFVYFSALEFGRK